MKIDSTDIGVFTVKVSHEDVAGWLIDPAMELEEVNGAIDEAASYAKANEYPAFVLIEIAKPSSDT